MNSMDMTNGVAVVTGGARGLGREIALAFFENAWKVAVNYFSSGDLARGLIETMGDSGMALGGDVSSPEEMSGMADEVRSRWGRVDVLVNNAGITKDSLLVRQSGEDWDRVMAVNLKGAFNAIRAFAPLMNEGGHIVNISSYSAVKGKGGQAAYSASKAALLGLTRSAAIELAGLGIRVNAVLPGYMPTSMGLHARGALERAKEDSLLGDLSDPKEAARFVVFLAGTMKVTGQVFSLESRIV